MDGSERKKARRKKTMTAADYVRLLNIKTAKAAALALVVCFAIFHGILHVTYGVTPCKGLLEDGMYKEGGDGLWQPWGCMMHKYTQTDSDRCFRYNGFYGKRNHFVLVGDSRMRQLYLAMKDYLSGLPIVPYNISTSKAKEEFKAHHDLSWSSGLQSLKLEFIWAPVLNQTMFQAFSNRWKTPPNIVVVGCATHVIKESNDSAEALFEFERNLTILRPILENLSRNGDTKVLWMSQPHIYEENLSSNRWSLTNEAINRYRRVSANVLSSVEPDRILVWSSLSRLADAALEQMPDGLHLPPVVLKQAF